VHFFLTRPVSAVVEKAPQNLSAKMAAPRSVVGTFTFDGDEPQTVR
jgi:hypothetical protein